MIMIYDISSYIIHYLLPYIYHPFPPGNGCALQYETITWLVGEAEATERPAQNGDRGNVM